MHKKFEVNRTKIKVSCQSCRKAATHDSKSDLPLSMDKERNCSLIFMLMHLEFSPVLDGSDGEWKAKLCTDCK